MVGRKFLSHLKPGVIKDLTKSIRVQLDTASTCNTLPERLAQSLIPRGQKITNDLTRYKATLFTDDNSKLTPMGKLELLAETTTEVPPNISCFERRTHTRKATSPVWLRLRELSTPEKSHARNMPILPEPIPAPRMFDDPLPNISLPSSPVEMTLEWVLEAYRVGTV